MINYSSPYARLVRRFVVVGVVASLAFLFSKVNISDPLQFANDIIAFGGSDYLDLLKVFVGAGVLAGLDKLSREWSNL